MNIYMLNDFSYTFWRHRSTNMVQPIGYQDLTEEECDVILGVIQRDMELRRRDKDRIEHLEKNAETQTKRAKLLASNPNFSETCCLNCCSRFFIFFNPKMHCSRCKYYYCKKCVLLDSAGGMTCLICDNEISVQKLTNDWFYGKVKERFKTSGSDKVVKKIGGKKPEDTSGRDSGHQRKTSLDSQRVTLAMIANMLPEESRIGDVICTGDHGYGDEKKGGGNNNNKTNINHSDDDDDDDDVDLDALMRFAQTNKKYNNNRKYNNNNNNNNNYVDDDDDDDVDLESLRRFAKNKSTQPFLPPLPTYNPDYKPQNSDDNDPNNSLDNDNNDDDDDDGGATNNRYGMIIDPDFDVISFCSSSSASSLNKDKIVCPFGEGN
ncbi:hypothetical protein HELRODRAFT_160008 [Helobdella robusta]|uniref:RabBD domain-containing protein n=1 Tax=Helobdella robusta TaxID=6412 RepID=T1EPN4_HELRO|nr:hypothetical protein HELRODRAFT_160008 [Helobdella robusta]ESO05915.1 hypothetical protein HELRODRAFT_160008 [Helobdella robusta]